MTYSKVSIANMALALVGAAPIRDFDENNKRARMCEVLYEPVINYNLSRFDWPFARKYKGLNELDLSDIDVPLNMIGYQLPNDCLTPRDIYPRGSRDKWEISGNVLYCTLDEVGLWYTGTVVSPTDYSDTFVDIVSLHLAVKICPAITQDKQLTSELKDQYRIAVLEAWESDANIGNTYREHDENPMNDTFVTPELADTVPTYPNIVT